MPRFLVGKVLSDRRKAGKKALSGRPLQKEVQRVQSSRRECLFWSQARTVTIEHQALRNQVDARYVTEWGLVDTGTIDA
jgi:hypothetical protein